MVIIDTWHVDCGHGSECNEVLRMWFFLCVVDKEKPGNREYGLPSDSIWLLQPVNPFCTSTGLIIP